MDIYKNINQYDLELLLKSSLELGLEITQEDTDNSIIEKAVKILSTKINDHTTSFLDKKQRQHDNPNLAKHLYYLHIGIHNNGYYFSNTVLEELYNKTNFLYWSLNLFSESRMSYKYITRDNNYYWGILDKEDLAVNFNFINIKATHCNKDIVELVKNRKYHNPHNFDIIFYKEEYRKSKYPENTNI